MTAATANISFADIKAELLELLREYLADKDESWRDETIESLQTVFQQWKKDHGNRDPMSDRFSRGLRARKKISFEDATPYECVARENGVTDYPTLLNYLIHISYVPLLELVEAECVLDLSVLSVFIEHKIVDMKSLLRIVRGVYDQALHRSKVAAHLEAGLIVRAPVIRLGIKSQMNLDEGREKGSEANKEKAQKKRESLREAAIQYFISRPADTVDECTGFFLKRGMGTPRTIRDAISGCKKIAQQRVREKHAKQS